MMRLIVIILAASLAAYIGTSYLEIVHQIVIQKARWIPSSISISSTSLWLTFPPRPGGNSLMIETPLLRLITFLGSLFVSGYLVRWKQRAVRSD